MQLRTKSDVEALPLSWLCVVCVGATVDNWTEEDHDRSLLLDTSDLNERLSVCLQLADARQPPDHRAKIVNFFTHFITNFLGPICTTVVSPAISLLQTAVAGNCHERA